MLLFLKINLNCVCFILFLLLYFFVEFATKILLFLGAE